MCRAIRDAMDAGERDDAEVLTGSIEVDRVARRASSIEPAEAVLRDVERALQDGRSQLEAFFAIPLGEREGPGFIRYTAGGMYRPHYDRATDPSWPDAARRVVSVVVFLNGSDGEFDGGVLQLFGDEPVNIQPATGLLVAFPADVLHEVTEVSRGTRDVIVDWFYPPRTTNHQPAIAS